MLLLLYQYTQVCQNFCTFCLVNKLKNLPVTVQRKYVHVYIYILSVFLITVVYFIVKKPDIHVCIRNNKVILNLSIVSDRFFVY